MLALAIHANIQDNIILKTKKQYYNITDFVLRIYFFDENNNSCSI